MSDDKMRQQTPALDGSAVPQASPVPEPPAAATAAGAGPESEESLRTAAVQKQMTALRADMQKLQERMAALQTQVATAMAEAPEINARINAALARLAAAQKKGGPA